MKLVDHPELLTSLRPASAEDPLRILVSACLLGEPCGVDGTDYGMGGELDAIVRLSTVHPVGFCPEDHGLGTPRTMPDLHGGDGRAVLLGKARVLDEHGADLTEGMIRGAEAMVAFARKERVELALLTDASGACGTQVIYDGCRFDDPPRRQFGVGVAAAKLLEAGIWVCSSRDHATLGRLRALLEPSFVPDPEARDHQDHPWVVEHRAKLQRPGDRDHEKK